MESFERSRQRTAVGRTAPGREADQVRAASHLAGGGHGVVARRVHVNQAARAEALGATIDIEQPCSAALGEGALHDATRRVSRCSPPWIPGASLRIAVPPWRTRRLTAVPNAALALMPAWPSLPPHSRPTVRWAAGTGSRVTRLASGRIRQHLADSLDAARHRLGRAAAVLDAEGDEVGAFLQSVLRHKAVNRVGLAAQAEHQHGGEIGVACMTARCTPCQPCGLCSGPSWVAQTATPLARSMAELPPTVTMPSPLPFMYTPTASRTAASFGLGRVPSWRAKGAGMRGPHEGPHTPARPAPSHQCRPPSRPGPSLQRTPDADPFALLLAQPNGAELEVERDLGDVFDKGHGTRRWQ